MKRLRTHALLLGLAAAAGSALAAAAWERQVDFANKLALRGYYDIAEIVLKRVENDPMIIGIFKAKAIRQIGDYYTGIADDVVRTKAGLQGYIESLSKANDYYKKHIAHTSSSREDKSSAQFQIFRNGLGVAEVHLQLFHDPRTPQAAKEGHKNQAVQIFKTAIEEARVAAAAKKAELDAIQKKRPAEKGPARDAWEKAYNEARVEYFRAQIEHLNARVRYARLLKGLGLPADQWQGELAGAAEAYKQLLLEFANHPAEVQANLYMGVALMEQGPKAYKDALERFETVWQRKDVFGDFKHIPCEAAYHTASIHVQQKKHPEAVKLIDDLLQFGTNGEWDVEEGGRTTRKIVDVLKDLEGAAADQLNQRLAADAFMLQAEALAAQAADPKTNAAERRKLYGAAFDIADAVGQVGRGLRNAKYAPLVKQWRKASGRPRGVVEILADVTTALQQKKYASAARFYTELIAVGGVRREDVRNTWFQVGQCYYAAERYPEAGIAFSAVSKWFPKPEGKALEAARAAIGAQAKQVEKAPNDPFEKALLERYRMAAEVLDPLGPVGVTIHKAKEFREQGKFAQAIELLVQVDPKNKAYANALVELGLTHKARFETLAPEQQKGSTGKAILNEMLAAFQKLLEHYPATMPTLTGDANADARERLTTVTTAGLLVLTDAYLREYLNDPKKVIELTHDLEKRYPGIERSQDTAGALYMKRMHAAYVAITQAKTSADTAPLLPVVEEGWKAARKFPQFEYLDRAATVGAYAYNGVAAKLEAEAKAAANPDAKKDLAARALQARQRAVEFYVELLRAAEKQDIKVYRYVVQGLRDRGRPEDHKTIIELAPKAIEVHGRDRRAFTDVLQIRTALGFAHYALKEYEAAIPSLLEVETCYETTYQDERQKYEKLKEEFDRDPAKFRNKAPQPPRRNLAQPEVKLKLGFAYLATSKRDQYRWCVKAYTDLLGLYKDAETLWIVNYNLVEVYRRLGELGQALKLIDRLFFRDPTMGGPASKTRFISLTGLILKDIEKLDDPVEKKNLKENADELLKRLSGK